MRKRIFGGALVALALAGVAFTVAGTAALADAAPKVIVCKFVGTPGVDETLQTGNNPISVSQNALDGKGFAGTFPFTFQDAQGQSVAIRYATGPTDNGNSEDLAYCQSLIPPVLTVVAPVPPTFTPATCDSPGSVTVPDQPEGVLVATDVKGNIETVTFSADAGFTLGDAQTVYTFDLTSGTPSGGCGGGNPPPPPVTPPVTPPVAPPVAPPSTGGSTVATTTTSVAATL